MVLKEQVHLDGMYTGIRLKLDVHLHLNKIGNICVRIYVYFNLKTVIILYYILHLLHIRVRSLIPS